MCHSLVGVDQAQIPQGRQPVHRFGNLRPPTEPNPCGVVKVLVNLEPWARCCVEVQTARLVEHSLDLSGGHLPAAGPHSPEKSAARGIGLVLLCRDGDADYIFDAIDFCLDGRIRRSSNALDPGHEPIMVRDSNDGTTVRDADKQAASLSICKRAQLATDVSGHRPLELKRRPLAAQHGVPQLLLSHRTVPNTARMQIESPRCRTLTKTSLDLLSSNSWPPSDPPRNRSRGDGWRRVGWRLTAHPPFPPEPRSHNRNWPGFPSDATASPVRSASALNGGRRMPCTYRRGCCGLLAESGCGPIARGPRRGFGVRPTQRACQGRTSHAPAEVRRMIDRANPRQRKLRVPRPRAFPDSAPRRAQQQACGQHAQRTSEPPTGPRSLASGS